MYVLNTLAPVYLIIVLGFVLCKTQFLTVDFFKRVYRLVYWIGLPCLLFYKTAMASYDMGAAGWIFLALLLTLLANILAAYLIAKLMRLPMKSLGTFVQAAFRGNLLFIGVPVIFFLFSDAGRPDAHQMESLAVLAIAPLVLIYNFASVFSLVAGKQESGWKGMGWLLKQIFSNPILIAGLVGILYLLTGWPLPKFFGRTCYEIGKMALPLALLGIGASLASVRIGGSIGVALTAVLIKIALTPVLGYFIARAIGLEADHLLIVLIYCACPSAVISHVMVEKLGGDVALSSSAIMLSSILSVLSLGIVAAFF